MSTLFSISQTDKNPYFNGYGPEGQGFESLTACQKKAVPIRGLLFLFRFKEIAKSKRQFRFGEEDRGRGYRAVAPLGRGCGVEQARSDDTACQEKGHPFRDDLFSMIRQYQVPVGATCGRPPVHCRVYSDAVGRVASAPASEILLMVRGGRKRPALRQKSTISNSPECGAWARFLCAGDRRSPLQRA